jgi:hypothetical protein
MPGSISILKHISGLKFFFGRILPFELIMVFLFLLVWIYPTEVEEIDVHIIDNLRACLWLEIPYFIAMILIVLATSSSSRTKSAVSLAMIGICFCSFIIFTLQSFLGALGFIILFTQRTFVAFHVNDDSKLSWELVEVFKRILLFYLALIMVGFISFPELGLSGRLSEEGESNSINTPFRTMAWGCTYYLLLYIKPFLKFSLASLVTDKKPKLVKRSK